MGWSHHGFKRLARDADLGLTPSRIAFGNALPPPHPQPFPLEGKGAEQRCPYASPSASARNRAGRSTRSSFIVISRTTPWVFSLPSARLTVSMVRPR